MAEREDRAAIETAREILHSRLSDAEYTALRRVLILAGEAVDMKAARDRKRFRDQQLKG